MHWFARGFILLFVALAALLGEGCTSENTASEGKQEPRVRSTSAADKKTGGPRRVADSRVKKFLVKGSKALERGNYQRAMSLADSAESYEPNLPLISFFRGSVYADQNRLDSASHAYQRVLGLDPTYPEAHRKLGDIAFDRGQFRTALRQYRQEETINSTSSLHVKIARSYQKLGLADSSRMAFEEAVTLDSTNANAHLMYGQFLEDQGELEAALTQSRAALRLDSENTNYQFAVGSQLYRTGDLEEAAKHLKRAADERLLHSAAQYNLGQVLSRLGRAEEADYYLARADSARTLIDEISSAQQQAFRSPDDINDWVQLGKLYREAGAFSRALQAFRRAVRIQPQNLSVQNQIAEVLLQEGHTGDAIRRLRGILDADRSFVDAWLNLGHAYTEEGRCEEARGAWRRVLDVQPKNNVAQRYLDSRCQGSR